MIGSNWRFMHVGMIVRDTLKTCEHFKTLGFEVSRQPFTTAAKSAENPQTSVIANMKKDSIVVEIIQPLEGRFVNKEVLDSIGEGVNHLCFEVDDFPAERARMEAMGFPVVYGSPAFAYFDTRKCGNLMIELHPPR